MAGDGIEYLDRILVHAQRLLPGRAHEAERNDFLIIAGDEACSELGHGSQRFSVWQHGLSLHCGRCRDVVKTVEPRGLLDKVFLDFQVEAVRRRRDDEVVAFASRRKAKAAENIR